MNAGLNAWMHDKKMQFGKDQRSKENEQSLRAIQMHVVRMPDQRIHKKLLYGKTLCPFPAKRFQEKLKATLKAFNINGDTWEETAKNIGMWGTAVH